MAGPLAGFRIIDVSERSPAAAIAAMILGDFGAEVIKVEPEGGDPLRALDGSRVWLRGQKSVVVGAQQVADGSWAKLRGSADAIIDTLQPWTAKPSGLLEGPDHPWQVRCVLSALPSSVAAAKSQRSWGAPPVYGELAEAQYGFMHVQEGYREQPIFIGWPHATYGAAWLMQIGLLGALYERERTGQGQVVTTSLVDAMGILVPHRWLGGQNLDVRMVPIILSQLPNRRNISALFECANGEWIQVHTGPRGAFERMMQYIQREDIIQDHSGPAYGEMDPAVASELWEYVARTLKTKSAWEWTKELNEINVCCLPALPPGDALWVEQMAANGLVDHTPEGRRQLGLVARFSRTPGEIRRGVPAPGEHSSELFTQKEPAGRRHSGKKSPNSTATERVGPLDGLLVLDFGSFMAGPFSPRLMADLGARVIKIEEVTGGGVRRSLRLFLGVQRGKEALAVNLKTEEGRQVAYELIKRADIVHHNMRMPAAQRLGLGYDVLRQINPKLIYCHSSGYGTQGPWGAWPAFEPLHSAVTGVLNRIAGQGNPPIHYLSHQDYGCGLTSTVAVLAALVERERSGQGQFLEVPQVAAGLLAMSDVYFDGDRKSETFALDQEQRGYAPTNALYRTSDGWILIACYCDQDWQGVRRALGIDGATWPDYRQARREPLNGSNTAKGLEQVLARLTTSDAERSLRGEGAPYAVPAPLDVTQLLADPTFRGHGLIMVEHHPEAGELYEVAHTIRFEHSTRLHTRPAPVLGQDTVAILREVGKTEAEIEQLIAAQVVTAANQPVPA